MKYWPPYDNQSDPNAPYVNGNPAVGQQGSIPPAESIEHPMREVVNMISNSDMDPLQEDLEQLTKAIRSGYINYAEDTGSTNALSVALDPPLTGYTIGLPLNVKVNNTNSGTSTINVNGLGGQSIVNADGSQLGPGSLVDGQVAQLMYDGERFQLMNSFAVATGSAEFRIPFAQDTGTQNHLVANFSPAITQLYAGLLIEVKALFINTGASDINVNGLGIKNVVDPDGSVLEAGDIAAGQVLLLIYDGAVFQLSSFIQSSVSTFAIPYVNDSGSQNALVGTYAPAITSYAAGLTIEIKAANRNTGSTTINVNGLGIKNIVSPDSQGLVDGAFDASAVLLLIYDGTNFQLVNFQSGRGVRFVTDTGSANALAVAPTPAVIAYRSGLELYVKKKTATPNTAAMTINVSGLGAKDIYTPYGDPHSSHMWHGDEVGQIVYDGTAFRLMPQRLRKRQLCVLVNASQANLPSGAWAEVVMNAEHDPNSWKSPGNSRIAIPCAGLYETKIGIWATQAWTSTLACWFRDVNFPSNYYIFEVKENLSTNGGGIHAHLTRVMPAGTYQVMFYNSNGSFRWNWVQFSMERID